jgi:branched-chain amino acid transport system permease protein
MPKLSNLSSWGLWAASMAALIIVFGWNAKPGMIGLFIASGLAVGSLYALGGIGIVVLYRTTGVMNFGAGAAGAAGAMTCWQLITWGWPEPIGWTACILVSVAVTLAYGVLIAPRLAWRDTTVKAVATLGFALIVLGAVAFFWMDTPRKLGLPTDAVGIRILGMRFTVTRLIVVSVSVAVVIGIGAFLGLTRVGLQMRALANDRGLSALLGIPILRVETIAWAISGVLAGFTGLMFGNLIRLEPVIITFMVIPSIAAAICGRLENLALVLLGGLSIGVIENLLTMSPELKGIRSAAPFLIATIVLLWMQRGHRLTFNRGD